MGDAAATAFSSSLEELHQLLVAAALPPAPVNQRVRRPSMCLDGTPLVYSEQVTAASARRQNPGNAFRLLVEPGGLGISVSEQVDTSLYLLDLMVQRLGWQSAAPDLNMIVQRVFPKKASVLRDWWGGIWLGLAATNTRLQLRLYLNLRHGDLQARWNRVADVLGCLGEDTLGEVLQALAARSGPLAIPVGLGVVISDGNVVGIRLYAGVHEPKYAALAALLLNPKIEAEERLHAICRSLETLSGMLQQQSVTVGYDFLLDQAGVLVPRIARTKFDVSCQFLPREQEGTLLARLWNLADVWQLELSPIKAFLADLEQCFGGYVMEYVSFTVVGEAPGVTVYAKPGGYANS